jgi:hypothetical protein
LRRKKTGRAQQSGSSLRYQSLSWFGVGRCERELVKAIKGGYLSIPWKVLAKVSTTLNVPRITWFGERVRYMHHSKEFL